MKQTNYKWHSADFIYILYVTYRRVHLRILCQNDHLKKCQPFLTFSSKALRKNYLIVCEKTLVHFTEVYISHIIMYNKRPWWIACLVSFLFSLSFPVNFEAVLFIHDFELFLLNNFKPKFWEVLCGMEWDQNRLPVRPELPVSVFCLLLMLKREKLKYFRF